MAIFPIKLGVQLASLRLPFKKALLTAAQLGATGVEIDARGEITPQDLTRTGVRQIQKVLNDLNLRVCAVGFHTRRGYNVADDIDRRVDATKQAMRMARQLGAPVVINHVGRIPSESSGSEWEILVQVLTDLGKFGQHIGAFLAAETGTEPGADLARLIQALPTGTLAVNFNPGNLVLHGYSPLEALEQLGPNILHVHAKDGVRDLGKGLGMEVPLGRGEVDFHGLIGALEEHRYNGFFTIERTQAANPELEIGQAIEFLKSL